MRGNLIEKGEIASVPSQRQFSKSGFGTSIGIDFEDIRLYNKMFNRSRYSIKVFG